MTNEPAPPLPPSRSAASSTGEDEFNVTLTRVNGEVVYEYLFTPLVAHALSASHVLNAFCDQMLVTYRKLAETAPTASTALTDAIIKIDGMQHRGAT